ncbi:MAG: dihydropteroate synthase [Candidatus Hydromicrobium americanum]|nr:MAG: dihydropteroate synthase [Candidatus Hydromicrobium americanum]
MKFKIRALNIKTRQEGLKEFEKIGATAAGSRIMVDKIFPISLKIRGINPLAANILKQEMLARGGDVVTSRNSLMETGGKADVIIQGTIKGVRSLIGKIKQQPFGLKALSGDLESYIDKLDENKKRKELIIGKKEFNLSEDVLIMGILNVTPDSFYDGGYYFEKDKACRRAETIVKEGAQIIDVGGMSTRPGSLPVGLEEEVERIIPVIEYISKNYDILVSADTYRSEVARRAIAAGAHIINDISSFSMDSNMVKVIAEGDVSVVVMHIKGTPENMQKNPEYEDVVDEIYDYLEDKTNIAIDSGIKPGKIIIDPGIGFGKTLEHNLEILNKVYEFRMLGYPVLIGASRKSFIGNILDLPVEERLEGSLAAAICSVINGVNILRVHDVKETIRAVKIAKRITNGF